MNIILALKFRQGITIKAGIWAPDLATVKFDRQQASVDWIRARL